MKTTEHSNPQFTPLLALVDAIPVLFFGADPGEKETQRWEKKKIRAAYVGSSYAEAAAKRADVLEGLGLENIDQNEDEEIGLVVLGSGEERPGDAVNTETISILEDRGFTLNVFEEPGSGEDEDSTAEEENADRHRGLRERSPDAGGSALGGEHPQSDRDDSLLNIKQIRMASYGGRIPASSRKFACRGCLPPFQGRFYFSLNECARSDGRHPKHTIEAD